MFSKQEKTKRQGFKTEYFFFIEFFQLLFCCGSENLKIFVSNALVNERIKKTVKGT